MHVILIHLLVLTMYLFFWLVRICCIQYCSYDKYFVVKCIVHKVVLLLIAVTASPTVAKAKKKIPSVPFAQSLSIIVSPYQRLGETRVQISFHAGPI